MKRKLTPQEAGRLGIVKSRLIANRKKQERIKKYNLNSIKCKNCNKSLPYDKRKNKFCNHSCSATFNNIAFFTDKGFGKHWIHGKYSKKYCLQCNNITENSKFCNKACEGIYKWKLRKEKIEKLKKVPSIRSGKEYLKKIKGNKCEICDLTKWQNKSIIMVMDHKDGNSDNNSLKNIRLICPNCDSQTDTYKNRNKGNGRYYRRKRYAENKSY